MVEYFHGMECFLPGMREEDAVVISRVGGGGRAVDTSMGQVAPHTAQAETTYLLKIH